MIPFSFLGIWVGEDKGIIRDLLPALEDPRGVRVKHAFASSRARRGVAHFTRCFNHYDGAKEIICVVPRGHDQTTLVSSTRPWKSRAYPRVIS